MKTKLKRTKIKSVHQDKRGQIYDIWKEPVHHVGIVTFVKGATRAKHYHKLSGQYNYLLKGKIKLVTKNVRVKNSIPRTIIMNEGDMVLIPSNYYHELTALTSSTLLVATTGSRKHGSEDYEKDTYRMEI